MARKMVEPVPLHLKLLLTPNEAARYAGIGMNKMSELLNMPDCPFLVKNGRSRLVKRSELERYIEGRNSIWLRLGIMCAGMSLYIFKEWYAVEALCEPMRVKEWGAVLLPPMGGPPETRRLLGCLGWEYWAVQGCRPDDFGSSVRV